jgi:hypothetical protein
MDSVSADASRAALVDPAGDCFFARKLRSLIAMTDGRCHSILSGALRHGTLAMTPPRPFRRLPGTGKPHERDLRRYSYCLYLPGVDRRGRLEGVKSRLSVWPHRRLTRNRGRRYSHPVRGTHACTGSACKSGSMQVLPSLSVGVIMREEAVRICMFLSATRCGRRQYPSQGCTC